MDAAEPLALSLRRYAGPPARIMEVCGTHTAEGFRTGVRSLLPPQVKLIAGPGCPVCVTPAGFIDTAVFLAKKRPDAVLCSFGDLVRVPGSEKSLAAVRAEGADVRVVYSPLDALAAARENPGREVVFLSVGFETTVPASCLALRAAKREGIRNFSLLCSNRTMDRVYGRLRGAADAFLYPGHVSVMTGMALYRRLAEQGVSGAVAGFGAQEMLLALTVLLQKLGEGKPFAVNCYPRVVTEEGNEAARRLVRDWMEPCDAVWRGLGELPGSGLRLRREWEAYDARAKFALPELPGRENPVCRCGEVLRGACEPTDCPLFGKSCAPQHPVGACMVSAEGSCSAYYRFGGTVWNE